MITLSEVAKILDAVFICGSKHGTTDFRYCRASDLMSDVLAGSAEGSLFLTGLVTVQSVRTASVSGTGAIVFVRGKNPSEEVIKVAREEDIPVLVSPHSMFVSCGRLYSSGLTGIYGGR